MLPASPRGDRHSTVTESVLLPPDRSRRKHHHAQEDEGTAGLAGASGAAKAGSEKLPDGRQRDALAKGCPALTAASKMNEALPGRFWRLRNKLSRSAFFFSPE